MWVHDGDDDDLDVINDFVCVNYTDVKCRRLQATKLILCS